MSRSAYARARHHVRSALKKLHSRARRSKKAMRQYNRAYNKWRRIAGVR